MQKLGVEIIYPEDTIAKQNQKGRFKIVKVYKENPKKELRFINSKTDRSASITIYPIEPNTTSYLKINEKELLSTQAEVMQESFQHGIHTVQPSV